MIHYPLSIIYKQKGSITPPLLIITASFIVIIYALLFMLSLQLDYSQRQVASEQALAIAETGINYYRWHLAHAPEDFQDGTSAPGPYVHDYLDPQGASIGKFSLEIIPPSAESSIVTIVSTGWTERYENIKRTIKAQYGKPSLTQFSFLQNASSWYGSGITIHGKVHSNNGIRMDGTNTSVVSSAKETYMCGSETGCHPPEAKPGVWGAGGDQGLWQFPMPAIDFDLISFDFASMKESAQTQGLYLGESGKEGYHIIFENETFRVFKVLRTDYIEGYSVPGQGLGQEGKGGCRKRYQLIASEELIDNYNLSNTPIIFAEDYLWVEGVIDGRLTVVAARFPITSNKISIWIPNSLHYAAYDHTDSLGLIAQSSIIFTRDVPDDFKIDGALIAKAGNIMRHGYFWWCGGAEGAVKDKLTINGSLISYFKSYWNFGSEPESGFITREITYDPDLLYSPPPFFPTSGEYEFISWTEE